MVVGKYKPKQGDIVWINFNPQKGSEQKGHRPSLCISKELVSRHSNMAQFAPITTKDKDYPLHIKLPKGIKTEGVVMLDQSRAMDYKNRSIDYIESVPKSYLKGLLEIVRAMYQMDE